MKNIKIFLMSVPVFLIFLAIGLNCEKKPTAPVHDNPYDTKGSNYPKGMVYVPAGEFTMGSTSGDPSEKPVHTVYLNAYYIDKYEVTNEKYAAYLTEALANGEIEVDSSLATKDGFKLIDLDDYYSEIFYSDNNFIVESGKENYPVINIPWHGAFAYAIHYGKRLPTEAEWEKAARGTGGRTYPWGNDSPDSFLCNFDSSKIGHTTSVGTYSPVGDSPYGCCDMAGNVYEWCNDFWGEDYYESSPTNNPLGPFPVGGWRVVRGGSWGDGSTRMRCASRYNVNPDGRYTGIGFRCVH